MVEVLLCVLMSTALIMASNIRDIGFADKGKVFAGKSDVWLIGVRVSNKNVNVKNQPEK